jgi:hypothetical protein
MATSAPVVPDATQDDWLSDSFLLSLSRGCKHGVYATLAHHCLSNVLSLKSFSRHAARDSSVFGGSCSRNRSVSVAEASVHLVVFPRYIPKNQRMANPHSDLFHGTEEPRDLFVNAIRVNSSVVMWAPCFGPRLLINEVPLARAGPTILL